MPFPRTDAEWESFWATLDVRPVMAELRAAGEPDLDRVPWERFPAWFAPGTAVPGLLRSMAGTDPDAADKAGQTLSGWVEHQGSTAGTAVLATPFLLRIAADPNAHARTWALSVASFAARRSNCYGAYRSTFLQIDYAPDELWLAIDGSRRDWTVQAAREALGADAAILISLIADEDPEVRVFSAFALAAAVDLSPAAVEALRTRLTTETEPAVRVSLVLAIAVLDENLGEAERWWRDTTRPVDVRFAAAVAWLSLADCAVPDDVLDLLTGSMPEMQDVVERSPWDFYHRDGPAAWLNDFLAAEPG